VSPSGRGRLFRQVYAAVLGAVLLFGLLVTLVRYLEPRRPGLESPTDEAVHLVTLHWLMGLLLLALTTAAVAYPVARRLTSRLERLQGHVVLLGSGRLDARVPVEGDDEVAELARSFNDSAARIEALVRAQRQLLANVSHELRTPLARLRVAVELLEGPAPSSARRGMIEDVRELDELIGELLVASRLESGAPLETVEDVDLLALAAEEAARTGAEAVGEPLRVRGDARLLRRLVRNLLENARVHGEGRSVEVTVRPASGAAELVVADRGPGVPEAERERIFEPFHRVAGGSRSDGSGSGLGLALVRQIARRHGGDARCLPREGGGSLFSVRLLGA
jgi:signal transduction histidine kinase